VNDSIVIIPTYDEGENVAEMVKAIFSLRIPFDVLIVDDNSPDGTGQIVKNLQKEVNDLPTNRRLHLIERKGKLGLGTAYIAGFKFCIEKGYQYIFEMDCDFSHNPQDLVRLYETAAHDGYDLVIGSRYVTGVNVVNWPIGRVLMSYFASVYVRIVTGMPVFDTTAGFKCYRKEVLETIPLDKIRFSGYAFQIEMKFTTWKLGFKIKEIPIIFTERSRGISKMSKKIFKEAVLGILKMKIKSWFKDYRKMRVKQEVVISDK
jgi:dolichol-phosphate mannosyltransferase